MNMLKTIELIKSTILILCIASCTYQQSTTAQKDQASHNNASTSNNNLQEVSHASITIGFKIAKEINPTDPAFHYPPVIVDGKVTNGGGEIKHGLKKFVRKSQESIYVIATSSVIFCYLLS